MPPLITAPEFRKKLIMGLKNLRKANNTFSNCFSAMEAALGRVKEKQQVPCKNGRQRGEEFCRRQQMLDKHNRGIELQLQKLDMIMQQIKHEDALRRSRLKVTNPEN